ncbi:MAG: sodium:solute symporter, partial [Betaproteobacteria bacterium]|nr:sodium:solute symporter [Betaproteobacteria bacterium]
LLFVVGVPSQYAIQLQLLGGIWIIQTLPAVVLGLYLRWLEPKSLLLGWAVGIGWGTWAAWSLHFAGSVYPLHVGGITVPGYIALYAVVLNGVVAALGSVIERTLSRPMVRAA